MGISRGECSKTLLQVKEEREGSASIRGFNLISLSWFLGFVCFGGLTPLLRASVDVADIREVILLARMQIFSFLF